MEEEKGRSSAGFNAVDFHAGGDFDVELRESRKHRRGGF